MFFTVYARFTLGLRFVFPHRGSLKKRVRKITIRLAGKWSGCSLNEKTQTRRSEYDWEIRVVFTCIAFWLEMISLLDGFHFTPTFYISLVDLNDPYFRVYVYPVKVNWMLSLSGLAVRVQLISQMPKPIVFWPFYICTSRTTTPF